MSNTDSIFPIVNPNNIFEVLDAWVELQPNAILYTFLNGDGEITEQLSYYQFASQVNQLAITFSQKFCTGGESVLLAYQPGLEMITALFACNKAGLTGIPTAPLTKTGLTNWQQQIQHLILDDRINNMAMCDRTHALLDLYISNFDDYLKPEHRTTRSESSPVIKTTLTTIKYKNINNEKIHFIKQLQKLNQLVTTNLPITEYPQCPQPREYNDIFLIQYTSGSTSEPKGVEITHANLLANAAAVVDHPKPIAVSWLPQHHDMGLIGYYIDIMLAGGCSYGFSATAFFRRPMLWFETINRYRATATSAPNFALELCLQERLTPHAALVKLDLSSMRFLMVAAEPVNPQVFFAFQDKFSRFGLPQKSLFVAYGLAEFTLAVTNYGQRALQLDTHALSQGIVRIRNNNETCLKTQEIKQTTSVLMSCGKALTDTTMKIVNPETGIMVTTNQVGEVWLTGVSKARGYRNQITLSRETFQSELNQQHYLRTGDLGFLHQNELFVCGRRKDILIIHGRNIYPQDIESALQDNCPQVRRNCVVAFQPQAESSASPGIVIAAELRRINVLPDTSELLKNLRETLQIPIAKIIFLPPKSIPKTSSGKIKRIKTREYYEQGFLKILAGDVHGNNDELDYLRQRYDLRGDEDITVFDAGIDSLDLIILLHWLQAQLHKALQTKDILRNLNISTSLPDRINSRLFSIITIQQLFKFANALNEQPKVAIKQAAQWLEHAYQAKKIEEQKWMLADSHYRLPNRLANTLSSSSSTSKECVTTALTADVEMAHCGSSDQNILLTGATGFLGVFLLNSLLQLSQSRLYILVRGDDIEQARQRLRQNLINTLNSEALLSAFDQRVNIVSGDLELSLFGLSLSEWTDLSHRVDIIFHNGALVNYLLDYQSMRASNVTGTRRILDFALSGKNKELNYISTTFIFGWASKAVLYEQDQNAAMEHLDFGYSQSKWVAEQLVYSAMKQGLSGRVFRPALITPALNGAGGSLDITTRLLAFMVKYGIGVETQNQVSFMPVDVTANNIVTISQKANSLGKTFHVTRDQHETLFQITELIQRKTGITFEYFALKEFVPEVLKRCDLADPLYPLVDFLVGSIDSIAAMEYKQYSNLNYQTIRNQSPHGIQDATLAEVVDGIISFLRCKDLMPCQAV